MTPEQGKIFIEISLREELHQPAMANRAKTLLTDPYSGSIKVNPINISSLSLQEAYAEKIRAALCRRKLAIRDYYDLDHALKNNLIDLGSEAFISLIKKKVAYEKRFHDFSDIELVRFLQTKIDGELVPTLKRSATNTFNLRKVIEVLMNLDIRSVSSNKIY
jgi:predicted nucleotidyltransferase component of viral defense system